MIVKGASKEIRILLKKGVRVQDSKKPMITKASVSTRFVKTNSNKSKNKCKCECET